MERNREAGDRGQEIGGRGGVRCRSRFPKGQTSDPSERRTVRSNSPDRIHRGLAIVAALLLLLPSLAFAWPQEWIKTVDSGIDPAEFAAT